MAGLAERLMKAVKDDGRTDYAIAKASGIERSHLSRFMSGNAGLSMDSIERLMAALGLVLVSGYTKKSTPPQADAAESRPEAIQAKPTPTAATPQPPRPAPGLSQYQQNKRKQMGME